MVYSEWISLNIEKTHIKQFKSNQLQNDSFQIFHQDKEIKEVPNIKFLVLGLDKHMEWKIPIEQIIPKMSNACYAIRSMYPFTNMTTLKIIYFAYFHSIMEYGIIFRGNSSDSRRVF
jgi:hypothetical protein